MLESYTVLWDFSTESLRAAQIAMLSAASFAMPQRTNANGGP
jgi:hypothetical protein